MFEDLAKMAQPVLDVPMVRRTRRNHGLEHATIHILSDKNKRLSMAGRSTDTGFRLFGEVQTSDVEWAVNEALRRMRNGEHSLAVHPNCGTNLVTTGMMTSLAAMVGLAGANRKESLNRLPTVMLLSMGAILFSQPVGMNLQKYFTTDGRPGNLEVLSITRSEMRTPLSSDPLIVHNVVTHSS